MEVPQPPCRPTLSKPYGGPQISKMSFIALPALVLLPHIALKEGHIMLPDIMNNLMEITTATNLDILFLYLIWIALHASVDISTLGGEMSAITPQRMCTRLNGLYHIMATVVVAASVWQTDLPVERVFRNLTLIIIMAFAFSLVLSICVFGFGEGHANPQTSCDGVYNFIIGKIVNPRIGRLDVKMFTLRLGLNTLVLLNLFLWIFDYKAKCGEINARLGLTSVLQMALVLHTFLQEGHMLSTSLFMHDGCGFLTISFHVAVAPFLHVLTPLYLSENQRPLRENLAYLCLILAATGFYIYHTASDAKNKHMRQEFLMNLQHLDMARKRFLTRSFWNKTRHPNYVGYCLIMFSWTLVSGMESVIPYVPLMFTIVNLIYRATLIENDMRVRYSSGMERYMRKVPFFSLL